MVAASASAAPTTYAERYHQLREQREDGEASGSSASSESDATEDEEGEQLTPHVDAAILRTLQKIRAKDPDVYDETRRVFDAEREAAAKHTFPEAHKPREKKLTLQDYQRQRLREAMQADDPAQAYAEATSKKEIPDAGPAPTHDQEQEAVRSAFLHAVDDDDEEGELFEVKKDAGEQGTYRTALLGALDGADESQVRGLLREPTDEAGAAPISKDDEDFLLNYVLNRGWVDPAAGKAAKTKERDWEAEAADLDSEASFDSAADAFEHAYNFRFEDPSLAQQNFAIESFPREHTDSVRRSDDRRKLARQERAERKKKEKDEKMQKLEKLKARKRQSIAEKLKQLRDVSGSDNRMDNGAFENLDWDADFDPEEHDRLMQKQFGDAYYGDDDGAKPQWDDDLDEIIEEVDEPKKKKKSKAAHDSGMDADFLQGTTDAKLSKKERQRLKKQEKKARAKAEHADGVNPDEMDASTAPVLSKDEAKAKAHELMDEYYNLGYEDVIGDMPTRFKYARVPEDNYGMDAVEILLADDAELNNVVGMKHFQPYRRGSHKPSNLSTRLKRFREDLATKADGSTDHEPPKKKRLGKKERMKQKAAAE